MSTPTIALTSAELKSAIIHNPLIVSADLPIIDAIAQMSGVRTVCSASKATDSPLDDLYIEARSSCVLVVEQDQLLGILTERDVVRLSAEKRMLSSLAIRDVMTQSVVTLRESDFTDFFFAVNLLQKHRIRHLPLVNDRNQLIGLLTHESLRQLSRPADLLRLRLVAEVMVSEVVSAAPNVSMLAIAHLMTAHRVSSIVIVQQQERTQGSPLHIPIGIVTERDIVQFQALSLDLDMVQAQAVMSTPVFTVNPEDSLWVVQQTMEQRLIRRLVVTGSQGELLGIVTQTSILNMLNPLELYKLVEILEQKVLRLETEKLELLENRNLELEQQVKERTLALKMRAEREQLSSTIASHIRSSLDLPEILDVTVKELRAFLSCDRVAVWQFQPNWSATLIAESTSNDHPAYLGQKFYDSCFAQDWVASYQNGRVYVLSDIHIAEISDCLRSLLERFQIRSTILIPIIHGDGLWGLLQAIESHTPRQWQPEESVLLQQLSTQLGIAVQQAVTYQKMHNELTERQQTETWLRESEQRYASLAEASPVGIFRTDAAGKCLYVNDRWSQIAGLPLTEALGKGWINGLHPDDREFIATEWHRAVQENRPFQLEYRFQRPDGGMSWVFGQAVAEQDATGQVRGYIGTITDISEQQAVLHELKATEQALKIQRDLNQLIAEITSRFVDLSPSALDAEIERTLQLIGEITQVETSYLVKFDPDAPTMSMTHEWSQPDCPRQIALAQAIPLALFPWSIDLLQRREINYIPCVADLPATVATDQAGWQRFNLAAVLSVPLIQKSVVTGFMGFASFSHAMTWQEETIRLLRVMGQTIANAQERAQDEQRLYANEERLRLALTAAKQGLYDLNLQTGDAIVTPEYAIMLGYDPATFEETNAKWIERLHPDDREAVANTYQMYVAGNLPEYQVEFRQLTQAGDWKWILSLGKIVAWDTEGNPLRMLGTHTDISDRKAAEAALRASQQHYQNLIENSPDIIERFDLELRHLYVSPILTRLTGIPEAEFLGKTCRDLSMDKTMVNSWETAAKRVLATGQTQVIEFDILTLNGLRHFEMVIVPELSDQQTIESILCISRDISDRKQAEAERLQAEQVRNELKLLENILDIILAGYWDWDIPNNQEYLSSGFKRMFGYADHELPNVPESWQRLIFAEDLPGVLDCFDRHVQSYGKVPFSQEIRYHHKNGSTIWVICSGQVIEWSPEGKPQRMIGCHIDITDRKQTEEQLQQLNADLKRSNQELEQFAYIASHDLQEPLRAINGYTQLLAQQYSSVLSEPDAQQYMGFITDGAQRMRSLIQDLLAYSRVGSRPLVLAPTDCNAILAEVLSNLQVAIAEHHAVITTAPLPTLLVDQTQLAQVFQNLIGNAIKFRREEPPQIHISAVLQQEVAPEWQTQPNLPPPPYWLFSVRDNGIGIKPQYLERIFDVFRRLQGQRKFSGTGIGLAICKKSVERHGGNIWAESVFGASTTFYFTLPITPEK